MSAAVSQEVTIPNDAPFMRIVLVERSYFGGDDGRRERLLRYVRASADQKIAWLSIIPLETGRPIQIKRPDSADGPEDVAAALDSLLDRQTQDPPQLQRAYPTLAQMLASHRDAKAAYARTVCRRGGEACERYLSRIEVVVAGATFHRDPNVDFSLEVPAVGCFVAPSQAYRTLTHPDGIQAETWPAEGSMPSLRQDVRLTVAVDRSGGHDARPGIVRFFDRLAATQGYTWNGVADIGSPNAPLRYLKLPDEPAEACGRVAAGEPGALPDLTVAQLPKPGVTSPPIPPAPPARIPSPPAVEAGTPQPSAVEAKPPTVEAKRPQPSPVEARPPAVEARRPQPSAEAPPPPPPYLDPLAVPEVGEPVVTVPARPTPPPPPTGAVASAPPVPARPEAGSVSVTGAVADLGASLAAPLRPNDLSVTLRWSTSPNFDLVGRATLTDLKSGKPAEDVELTTYGFTPKPESGAARSATGRFVVGRSRNREFAVGLKVENGQCRDGGPRFATVEFAAGSAVSITLQVNGRPAEARRGTRLRLTCANGRPQAGGDSILVKVR